MIHYILNLVSTTLISYFTSLVPGSPGHSTHAAVMTSMRLLHMRSTNQPTFSSHACLQKVDGCFCGCSSLFQHHAEPNGLFRHHCRRKRAGEGYYGGEWVENYSRLVKQLSCTIYLTCCSCLRMLCQRQLVRSS